MTHTLASKALCAKRPKGTRAHRGAAPHVQLYPTVSWRALHFCNVRVAKNRRVAFAHHGPWGRVLRLTASPRSRVTARN